VTRRNSTAMSTELLDCWSRDEAVQTILSTKKLFLEPRKHRYAIIIARQHAMHAESDIVLAILYLCPMTVLTVSK